MYQNNVIGKEQRFNPQEMLDKLAEKYQDDPMWREVSFALKDSIRKQTTCGEFKSETDACAAFDGLINPDFFYVENEVVGRRLFDDKPVDSDQGQGVRIDRLLFPTQKAFNAGWIYGPIAVEIKKSNMAIGPILSQILEYRQSVFISKRLRNTRIMPLVFAIFPAQHISHDLQSLQENQIILSCHSKKIYPDNGQMLRIDTFGRMVLEIMSNGLNVGPSFKPNIRKGHRGREK